MAVRMRFRERNWKMEISLVRSIRGARENTIFSIRGWIDGGRCVEVLNHVHE